MTGAPSDDLPVCLFVINSLAGGGAERVMTTLLAHSRAMTGKYRLHLALLDQERSMYAPPDFVTVHQLDCNGGQLQACLQVLALVDRLKPRVMLSFLTRSNVAAVVAGRLRGVRTVISERVDTRSHFGKSRTSWLKSRIVSLTYPHADKLIAVSAGVADGLARHFSVPPGKMVVIDNPVDVDAIRAAGDAAPSLEVAAPYVAAAGRLVPNKNFALLIEAFARSGIGGTLVIMGEGPERKALTEQIAALGLEGRVLMPGFVANPFAVTARARIFVLPSNAEGFPNSLVEAMALGVPVISTNCASGPSEILAERPRWDLEDALPTLHGVLTPVGCADAMARALAVLEEPQALQRYSGLAQARARAFGPEIAAERYWSVLEGAEEMVHEPA